MTTPLHDHNVKPAACPNCEKVMDGAANLVGQGSPEPGDYTLCYYCRAWLVFTDVSSLRRATPEEVADIRKILAEQGVV